MCHILLTFDRDYLYSRDAFFFWEFTGKADTCAIETMVTRDSLRSKCHVTTAPMHFPLHCPLVRLCVLFYHKNSTQRFILWKSVVLRVFTAELRRLNLLQVVRALLNEFHSDKFRNVCNL